MHDYAFVANYPLERSWANPKSFKIYKYYPKKSQDLLTSAGFKKNKDGNFEKDGKILEFEILAMRNDPLRVSLAGILKS